MRHEINLPDNIDLVQVWRRGTPPFFDVIVKWADAVEPFIHLRGQAYDPVLSVAAEKACFDLTEAQRVFEQHLADAPLRRAAAEAKTAAPDLDLSFPINLDGISL